MTKVEFGFIIPVHNESPILEKQIRKLQVIITVLKIKSYEILIIENGSTDNSWQKIKKLALKYKPIKALRINRASYGRALKHGLLSSQANYIFMLNLDLFNELFFTKSLKLIKTTDLVIASKRLGKSVDSRRFHRRLVSALFNKILNHFFAYDGTDTHGLKLIKNSLILKKAILACRCRHELFDTELLLRLSKKKLKITEVPIEIKEIRKTRYRFLKREAKLIIDLYRILAGSTNQLALRKKTIVHADDYGISSLINQAILDHVKSGTVKIVSVLPNYMNKKNIQKLKRLKSKIDISIHLNFVRGKALSPQISVRSLVNQQGNFYPLPIFILKLLFKRISLSELQTETIAQIKHFEKLKLKACKIDSEQHTHTFSPLLQIVYKQAQQNQLKIRDLNSSRQFLRIKPIKHLIYQLAYLLLNLVYPRKIKLKKQYFFTSQITHPGNDYD